MPAALRPTFLAMLLAAGCQEHGVFMRACADVHPGMNRHDVETRLGAAGGTHALVGESDTWQRESLVGNDVCEVTFDRAGRVRVAVYRDWSN